MSTFTPLTPLATPAARPGWRPSLIGSLDAVAFSIPLSLGSTALVFGRISPDLLGSGVLALMLVLCFAHLALAGSSRPVVFSARFFESTTLAAMIDQAIVHLPAWGLPDTIGVRVALLCSICAGAGAWVGVLYLLRADRFTRYIPAPVFAGFSNSIAVALLVTQAQALKTLVTANSGMVVLAIAAAVLAAGVAVRKWRPTWPAATVALLLGVVLGLVAMGTGSAPAMVTTVGGSNVLPVALADFQALAAPGVKHWSLASSIASQSAILGVVMFINTTLAAQVQTQADGRRRRANMRGPSWMALVLAISGGLGGPPLSGSAQASNAASRTGPITARTMLLCGATAAVVYLSGVLSWVPIAALCGALLAEAAFMVHVESLRHAWRLVRGEVLQHNAREDLALIALVTATAVLFNMVAALVVGLMLGLVLFAARNSRQPVRATWSGAQVRSNCARSRTDLRVLAEVSGDIRVFELDGDLFFGTADQLETDLIAGLSATRCAILDWSRVRHVDSSVALAIAKVELHAEVLGIPLLHAGVQQRAGNVAAVMLDKLPSARMLPDLDHALEQAENHLLHAHQGGFDSADATSALEAAAIYRGLTEPERARLEASMEQRLYAPGDHILTAGEPADELLLVLEGTASVVVETADGQRVRLAGVRRGATLGEIGFLDRSTRSAHVIATDAVTAAVLRRPAYDALCETDPALVQKLLSNVAADLAVRLRQTTRLAIARQQGH